MFRCKAREILRNEAYVFVRRSDEGFAQRRRWSFSKSLLVSCPRNTFNKSQMNCSYVSASSNLLKDPRGQGFK